jgi:ectoine hydroxylase-related dioxygenase (phytanoyl-CoA dioxygenase family)
LHDIGTVSGVSDPSDEHNDLSRVANKYTQVLATAKAGDVVFFGGHVLHRSKKNFSADRYRRSFVSHYCNARSFTQWGGDSYTFDETHSADTVDSATGMTNGSHILARGNTHLPFAQPRFATPCAALLSPEERQTQSEFAAAAMGDMDSGMMGMEPADPNVQH